MIRSIDTIRSRGSLFAIATFIVVSFPVEGRAQTQVYRLLAGQGLQENYGTGVGAAGGIEFPFIRDRLFFLGLRGVYHLGKDGDLPALAIPGGEPPYGKLRQFHYGIEIGTTWMSSPILVRTVGGIGAARVKATVDQGDVSVTGWRDKLQYGPGLLLAFPTQSGRFFGIETRWVKVSDFENSFAIYGTLGTKIF